MMSEEDCKPSEKFLLAVALLSVKTIEAWKGIVIERCKNRDKNAVYYQFLNWSPQKNELALVTTYAYADIPVPKQFDCIFNYDNPEIFVCAKFVITQSLFEGWYPLNAMAHGCKHVCILKFEDRPPMILDRLHYETETYLSWKWEAEKVLGFCQKTDIPAIIERRRKETALKMLHGDKWLEFDDGE